MKLTVAYSLVFKYNKGDHLAFQKAISENPTDRTAKLVYSDYLQDHDLASEEDINKLRTTPGRVRFTTHPNGTVNVHSWLTPKKDWIGASSKVVDANNSLFDHANTDDVDEHWDDIYSKLTAEKKNAHENLAQILSKNQDPRAELVRRAAKHSNPHATYLPFNEVDRENMTPSEALGTHIGDFEGLLDPISVHENRRQDGIPLEDGTKLHYEIVHPTRGVNSKPAVVMHWDAKNNDYKAVYSPQEAESLIKQTVPEHINQFRNNLAKAEQYSKEE